MKRGSYAAILVAVFTVVVVIVLVASFALSSIVPQTPTATATTTSQPTLTATPDPCLQKNINDTVQKFDELSREFNDAFLLAQNTAAAQLSPIISNMQRIRREAQDYAVPICLSTLKQDQLGFMNSAIDASLTLYSTFGGANPNISQDQGKQAVALVSQQLNQARQFSAKYTNDMAMILGVTLTPSPTALPTVTPSAPVITGTP